MIRIFTDCHIGNSAGAHTTHSSSKLLDQRIFDNAMLATKQGSPEQTTVCVGDLFDKFSNKESVILQGMSVAKNCDIVLAGNHDLSNRDSVESSIAIVGKVFDNVCVAKVNETKVEHFEAECGAEFTVIPHHSSQDLFDEAIIQVCTGVTKDLLFLHCNFNSPFANNDSSLNITPEQCEELLKYYRYIILGHEHNTRWEMQGRLLVVGTPHPTNFGDISDKYFWDYNSATRELYETQLWSKGESYLKLTVKQLLDGAFVSVGKDFIEVVGTDIEPDLAPEIAQAMHSIWQVTPELLMLRNNVSYKSLAVATVDKTTQLEDVTKAISKDLEGGDLHELWITNLKSVEN